MTADEARILAMELQNMFDAYVIVLREQAQLHGATDIYLCEWNNKIVVNVGYTE